MLRSIQARLNASGDNSLNDELAAVQSMLTSPLFKTCVTIQESLEAVKEVGADRVYYRAGLPTACGPGAEFDDS